MFRFLRNQKSCLLIVAVGFLIFAGTANSQTTCEAVPKQILVDLVNQADLPAVAAQYGLEQTPIDQVGIPPTYRMRIRDDNTQNPCQVAQAMQGDTRITQRESNRKLKVVEK